MFTRDGHTKSSRDGSGQYEAQRDCVNESPRTGLEDNPP